MESLRIASLMAENADFIVAGVARYLQERVDVAVEVVGDVPWQERQRMLDAGEVHVAWICGLPYVLRADKRKPRIELLAAPVMEGDRYDDRPIYFSDVVVRRDSDFHVFADLQGASWAYNEPGSHSGYNVVRHYLATMCDTWEYFSRVVESGSHQASLQMILEGEIDASAIDSTVLELELERDPSTQERIRIIKTLGPSPIPPFVVRRDVPRGLRESVREALIGMDETEAGRAVLAEGPVAGFARVEDRDYDVIRRMAKRAIALDAPAASEG
jgi:phosphonate transport system substrate-binding protein